MRNLFLLERGGLSKTAHGGNMFPLGGKAFCPGKERRRAIQALGKRVAQEVNAEGGRPVSEELRTIHGD